MTEKKRIETILEEYFEFCLSLFHKIPGDILEKQTLIQKAYVFRDEIQQELINSKTPQDYCKDVMLEIRKKLEKE